MAASAHRPELVEVKASEMKRPKTAWGLFLEEYKKNRSNVGGIEKFNELQKAASAQWKRMTPEEKEPWIEKERINNANYVQKRLEQGTANAMTPCKRRRISEPKGYRRAFQFFVNEHRQQNPMYWSLFTFNQAQRELSAAWNAMPPAEKQKWFLMETAQEAVVPDTKKSKPQPLEAKTRDRNSDFIPVSSGVYSAAGMLPLISEPQNEYYASPGYSEYTYSEDLSPNFYSSDGVQFLNASMQGAARSQGVTTHEPPSSIGYPILGFSSRSHSDSDLQMPDKKHRFSIHDSSTSRCDSSYSDGAIGSPKGLPVTFSSTVLDEDENAFDLENSETFLDADQIF